MIKISIIIPVLNQVDSLDRCLSTLYSQLDHNKDIEVIVMDNGSSDGSDLLAEKYRFIGIQFLDSKNPYKARNKGADIANGNNLVFLDAKCLPLSKYISELEKLMLDNNWDIVAGDFNFIGLSAHSSLSELAYAIMHLRTNPIFNGGEVSALTGNMVVKKDVFMELGKFEEKRSGGDVRFSQLAKKKGKRKIFDPKLKVSYQAKNYFELTQSIKRDAQDIPYKQSIFGVRPAGNKYIEERLRSFDIELSGVKKIKLQFFVMYLRLLKYMYQYQ